MNEFLAVLMMSATQVKKAGAPISVPIVVAQALLESGYGKSGLSVECKNLFGIKGSWKGGTRLWPTREYQGGQWVTINAPFACYESYEESFAHYADLISRLSWYRDAADAADSPLDYLRGILVKKDELGNVTEPGWATDPKYEQKVWALVEQHDLLSMAKLYAGTTSETLATLVQVYEGRFRLDFRPVAITLGETRNGDQKIMIRVEERPFLERIRRAIFAPPSEPPELAEQGVDTPLR